MVEAELIFSDLNTPFFVLTSIALFFVAAVAEIGGGYIVWKWLRERKGVLFGILGGTILFIYGVILTFQPAQFGRVYAAYGGIFIISSILWGMFVDRKKPDRYEIFGSVIAVIGAVIIFYAPR
ncbi:MAG: YnfA family protein [Ignavibacteriales bacterium]